MTFLFLDFLDQWEARNPICELLKLFMSFKYQLFDSKKTKVLSIDSGSRFISRFDLIVWNSSSFWMADL